MSDQHLGLSGTAAELDALRREADARWREFAARGLRLDMTRGKPSPEQLTLSGPLLDDALSGAYLAADGTDVRNYGGVSGLPEMRALFAEILDLPEEQVVAAGNSSLELMHGVVSAAMLKGVSEGTPPWSRSADIAFLCPVPGYDRHFQVCEELGIRMIPVPMTEDGPDLGECRRLVADDPSIKGMWCVPKYSNPTGAVYSPEVVRGLASMPAAAPDFRLFWDNAYVVHHLGDEPMEIENIVACCAQAGHPDRPFVFASTSKVTLPGAGVAALGSSPDNIRWWLARTSARTIGPDKINQLRHARFLRGAADLRALMDAHRRLLTPKFAAVQEVFDHELTRFGVARWTRPRGGYFIGLEVPDGCAARTVALAADAGIALTPAGATWPHGHDPRDKDLRIAPSFPPVEEVRRAAEGIARSILLAAAEQAVARNAG